MVGDRQFYSDEHRRILREAVARGVDPHITVAAWFAGVHPGEVTPKMRGHAKAINYILLYGADDGNLA